VDRSSSTEQISASLDPCSVTWLSRVFTAIESSADRSRQSAINALLIRFFRSFDGKDWRAMRACLCDEVFSEGPLSRAGQSRISGDLYVEQRIFSLQSPDMQHDFFNLRIELDATGETATARCHYIVHRFHPTAGASDYFHSYGHCLFGLTSAGGSWKIARITRMLQHTLGNRTSSRALRVHSMPAPR
jgi:SnoaL-like domain